MSQVLENLQSEIAELLTSMLGIDRDMLKPEASLIRDLGIDSFGATELLVIIEQKYNITILEEDLQDNETFGEWVAIVHSKLSKNKNHEAFKCNRP
jgi:acyl carrier protein